MDYLIIIAAGFITIGTIVIGVKSEQTRRKVIARNEADREWAEPSPREQKMMALDMAIRYKKAANENSMEYCPILRDDGFIPCEESCPFREAIFKQQVFINTLFDIHGNVCRHPDYYNKRVGKWDVEETYYAEKLRKMADSASETMEQLKREGEWDENKAKESKELQ